jgi:metal-responsive CopG/Arc/MetJ family transcriptional regulator
MTSRVDKFSLSLPKDVTKELDKRRGAIPRSTYITILLKTYLMKQALPAQPHRLTNAEAHALAKKVQRAAQKLDNLVTKGFGTA